MRYLKPMMLVLACLLANVTFAAPEVRVAEGVVKGAAEGAINVFKGIPYAAPPTGSLRWAPPAPAPRRAQPLDATSFGPACPQPGRPDRARGFGEQDEDCLSLNIWAHADASGAPVMVWIHGGAFRIGKGGTDFYSGEHFANNGVVLVSINYRLGHLGFFAHPQLSEQQGDEPLGNYGLMDQIAALRWIQANISAFGGDPGRVTIFGESAGGASVLNLLMINETRGLYQQAIVQSGGGTGRARYLAQDAPGAPSLESVGLLVAKQLGVDQAADPIAALRALPADRIVTDANAFEVGSIGFGPVIDGKLITQPTTTAFLTGAVNAVPMIIGANSYEASVLAAFQTPATAFLDQLGPLRQRAREVYAEQAGNDETLMAEFLFGDASFVAPARFVARTQSPRKPVFLYHLDFVRERARGEVKGANHGADVILVFNTLDAMPMSRVMFTAADRRVADTIHRYWVSFAKTGSPNGASLPSWPAYSQQNDTTLYIGNDVIEARSALRNEQLDFAMQVITGAGAR
ncbi:MAG: carboxylesterase/lipase family protein [Pseudomonadota bacterium]